MSIYAGADSVSASGMPGGLEVYCYYKGSFENEAAVKGAFPGKKYLGISTSVRNTDCYDIEPGGGSASLAATFYHQWTKGNTDKPVFYASSSNLSSIMSALSGAGISRSQYYIFGAAWDGSSSIPGGWDAKQYANHPSWDADSFQSYMFTGSGPTPPPAVFPLQINSTGSQVSTLQSNLNKWATLISLKPPLTVDGNFGMLTQMAVQLAQVYLKDSTAPAGECSQELYNKLAAAPTPPPVPGTVVIDGFNVAPPNATNVPCVISWSGAAGVTRRLTKLPQSVWQGITWESGK